MSASRLCRLTTALAVLFSCVPSLAGAQDADRMPYVASGATNKRGDACFSTEKTNAAVHLLSGFLEIWTPRTPFVDAGVEAPAKGDCPAVAKTDWDGVPFSATDGHVVNQVVHDANIAYVVKVTRGRTAEQAVAAYLDDRRGKNASIVDGLGPLTDAWKAGTKQTTTIAEVAADATKVKYDDKGNNRGLGSEADAKAGTEANPDLGLAVDLINAAGEDASTEPAKRYFKYARPYRWSKDVVVLPTLEPAKSAKPAEDGGFPSGHTAEAWRDALTMAYLVPQRFQEMVTRGFEMGENRILAGMHSPLDVMGGRVLATAQVVYNLNKPENAALRNQAHDQAQSWLAGKTGAEGKDELLPLAHSASLEEDRFADQDLNRAYVASRLTYGFQPIRATDKAALVPQGAEVLLETRFPYLDAAQRREVLMTTEIASGYPLLDDPEGYGRLDLFAAADGYGAFDRDVTVTMDEARGGFDAADSWRNDIGGKGGLTKRGSGTLGLAGVNTYAGGTTVDEGTLVALAPSAFGVGDLSLSGGAVVLAAPETVLVDGAYRQGEAATLVFGEGGGSRLAVKGPATLAGRLVVELADGYEPKGGEAIELISASSISGTFGSVEVKGHAASVDYGPAGVMLTIKD